MAAKLADEKNPYLLLCYSLQQRDPGAAGTAGPGRQFYRCALQISNLNAQTLSNTQKTRKRTK